MSWIFNNKEVSQNLVSSLILVFAILALRLIASQSVRKIGASNLELKKRWIGYTRNISLAILVLGMVIIWAAELRSFAISLVAVAAAIVIATKELILCSLGGLFKATSKPFRIGDRIEIDGNRGDVTDQTLLTTTLDEIGPGNQGHQYTGKKLTLPNSIFLTHPIYNESVLSKFTLHTFKIPCSSADDVQGLRNLLLDSATRACKDYLDSARSYMKLVESSQFVETPNMDPRVSVHIPTHDTVDFIVRVPVPSRRAGRIEQLIVTEYLKARGPYINQ